MLEKSARLPTRPKPSLMWSRQILIGRFICSLSMSVTSFFMKYSSAASGVGVATDLMSLSDFDIHDDVQ
jgi:hypothetical protein